MKMNQLLFESRIDLFKAIASGNRHAALAARAANISYRYASRLMEVFESHGLVERHRKWGGRAIELSITPRGLEVWKNLSVIESALKNEN